MRSMPFSCSPSWATCHSRSHPRASGHPVFVDNDVNALALGEWMFASGGALLADYVAIAPELAPG